MKLHPVYKDIIWGGDRLVREYGKTDGGPKIAESWELAVHKEGVCTIANGEYAGMKLNEYLGSDDFPTLIKLIDACDNLSIQVHPAKTEMWYIVEAEEGAQLVYGLKGRFDEKTFRKALAEGTVEQLLRYVPVHKGDIFFIPTGLVHAIGKGILIAEIQQNSNITYRVYDYNRLQNGKPRELHVEQAISVIRDFTEEDIRAARFSVRQPDGDSLQIHGGCKESGNEVRRHLLPLCHVSERSRLCRRCSGQKGRNLLYSGRIRLLYVHLAGQHDRACHTRLNRSSAPAESDERQYKRGCYDIYRNSRHNRPAKPVQRRKAGAV